MIKPFFADFFARAVSHRFFDVVARSVGVKRIKPDRGHQHEARPFLNFRNRLVFLCSLMRFMSALAVYPRQGRCTT